MRRGGRWKGVMNDRLFLDPRLAELYDLDASWERRPELAFYMTLVMSAESVLDVGCGTGELLRLTFEAIAAGSTDLRLERFALIGPGTSVQPAEARTATLTVR